NLARAAHVGIDLDGDGRVDMRLTPNQSPTRQKTYRDRSEFEASAFGRRQFVHECRARLRLDIDASLACAGQFHLRRIFVFDDQRNVARGVVGNRNAYLSFGADRKATAKMPLNAYALRPSAVPRVEYRCANQ